jgi:F-type H+-transporting ATPase subunit epsilon
MKTFHLEIAAPSGLLYDGDAYMVSVRGIEGELSVLAGHIPLVTALASGSCRVYPTSDGAPRTGHASGGILTVSETGVRILAADFEWKD